jgi:hypothetical protein
MAASVSAGHSPSRIDCRMRAPVSWSVALPEPSRSIAAAIVPSSAFAVM